MQATTRGTVVLTLPGRKILHNMCSGEAAAFLQQQPVVVENSTVSRGHVKSKDVLYSDD